jgi:hypothetical protein
MSTGPFGQGAVGYYVVGCRTYIQILINGKEVMVRRLYIALTHEYN